MCVRPIILVLGPTAGGKTELAIELAQRLPGGGECVCADSMQVYRGMDIGTAKPTAAQRESVPHHLLDVADPDGEDFSVDRWLALAEQVVREIRERRRWPIVVGGTNLYVQALLKGLCEGPGPDRQLRRDLEELDEPALRSWLERVDPEAATRIHPNDRRRAIRAIEVHERTGQPLSRMQSQWEQPEVRPDAVLIGLEYSPAAINRRINARVTRMVREGLAEETAALHGSGRLGSRARQALGYRQILDHLARGEPLDEAVEAIKIATRRFAKQQRTWLRRFSASPRSAWLAADEAQPQVLVEQALEAIIRLSGYGSGRLEQAPGEAPADRAPERESAGRRLKSRPEQA
jgi:tRNA dimethylallyltransferase